MELAGGVGAIAFAPEPPRRSQDSLHPDHWADAGSFGNTMGREGAYEPHLHPCSFLNRIIIMPFGG
jgi:hypothetical protein